jgi:hypothetical protein
MCPVCLATVGLYVVGGVSAGGITTYLATRVLRGRRDQHAGDRALDLAAGRPGESGPRDSNARAMEAS